jgi:DNA-binding protein YbaB
VSDEFGKQLENLFESYQQQRMGLTALQNEMKAISVTVASPRREVEVTVNSTGGLTDLKFPTSAYRRLAPAELSALILDTLGQARSEAREESAALLTPLLPPGFNAKNLVSGEITVDDMLPEEMRLPTSVREQFGLGRASS